MKELLALLLASLNGFAVPNIQAPPELKTASRGLLQASRQAPRVPLDQLVPTSYPSPPRKPPEKRVKQRQPKQTSLVLAKGRCRQFEATAYGPPWGGIQGGGITATGIKLQPGMHVIAVDPKVIPLGSKLYIQPNPHGWSKTFSAQDTGGAIQGMRLDFFMWQGHKAVYGWGRQQVRVCRARD